MSDPDKLKTQFQTRFDALQSAGLDGFKQVFKQEEATLESDVSDDQNVASLFGGEEFPRVLVSFSTESDVQTQHILSMETGTVAQLYAWMIGKEPEETVGDEQLKGLQEAANQVIEQLTAAAEGETAFTVDDLKIELTNSVDDFSIPPPEENGLGVNYSITVGESTFSFSHYSWTVSIGDNEAESEDVDSDENADGESGTDNLESPVEEKIDVAPAEFDDFDSADFINGHARNMDMLLDVELEVEVELGKKPMKIQDVLKLGKGSVIELEKNAGEPLEVFVNNRKLAEGEVVVVDDHIGIRITQLVSPKDRIKSLG